MRVFETDRRLSRFGVIERCVELRAQKQTPQSICNLNAARNILGIASIAHKSSHEFLHRDSFGYAHCTSASVITRRRNERTYPLPMLRKERGKLSGSFFSRGKESKSVFLTATVTGSKSTRQSRDVEQDRNDKLCPGDPSLP